MIIDELFESLYEQDSNEKIVTYGKQLCVTDSQIKTLVALAYIFPKRLYSAIELIESGKVIIFSCGPLKSISVDGHLVSTRLWSCPCHDYLRQTVDKPEPTLRWERVCKHLLAAFITEKMFPILDFSCVSKREITEKAYVALNLNGCGSLHSDDFL